MINFGADTSECYVEVLGSILQGTAVVRIVTETLRTTGTTIGVFG